MRNNFLFITADQFRHDALGCRGVFPIHTPHLDALAAGGTVFDQAYCPNPMCVPARASIMTGLPCHRHGVYYNDQAWSEGVPTLPAVLAANGYDTVEVGKTHFFPTHRHGGFQKVILPSDYHQAMRKKYGAARKSSAAGTGNWEEMIIRHYTRQWDGSIQPEDYEPTYFTTRAIAELEKLVRRRECTGDASEPFFMWLSLLQPHSPCAPPPPYDSLYRPEDLKPPVKSEAEKEGFAAPLRGFSRGWEALPPEIIANFRARYLGSVSLVDHEISRMLAALRSLGLHENTIVIFSSDHGEYAGDHHQMQKGFFHDAASRVPLIFSGPGIAVGHRVSGEANLYDLKPTLLDLCGLLRPPVRDRDGRCLYHGVAEEGTLSLRPALQGGELPGDRVNVSESGIYGQGMMAKRGREKFNYYPQTNELDYFDLETDPDELINRGREFQFSTLPSWARETFAGIMRHTAPLQSQSYCFEGRVRRMFT